mmetsp:Transcript_18538/g.53609  ORF Transcript_18538/g.53609 Transcript_18538/m.53609 type:complete len:292 (+) Transcript_18538:668-1543(+)
MVDDSTVNIVGLENFKNSSRSMQVTDSFLGLEHAEDRVQVLDLLDGFFVFISVQLNDQSDGSFRKLSILGKSILQRHQGDGIWQRILFELFSRNDDSHADLDQTTNGSPGFSVTRWGDCLHEDRIDSGNILERHTNGRLASQLLVQILNILLGEHFGVNRSNHTSITVQESTNINGISLLLLRKFSLSSRVTFNVSSVRVRLHSFLSFLGFGVSGQSGLSNFSKSVAWSIFVFRILSQRDSNGITQSIGQQSSNTDGRLHTSIFSLTSFGNTQVKRVVPSQTVHFSSQQTV